MKENIDLTLDRIFNDKNSNISSERDFFRLNKASLSILKMRSNLDNDITSGEKELLFTGDREQRKKKMFIYDYFKDGSMEYCFKCGKRKYAYDLSSELCSSCDKELDESHNPFEDFNL